MSRRVTLRIKADGTVAAKIHGFSGPECMDYVSVLEKLLDATTESTRPTDEYYQAVRTNLSETSSVTSSVDSFRRR